MYEIYILQNSWENEMLNITTEFLDVIVLRAQNISIDE